MKFNSFQDEPVNGSNMCNKIFGISGVTRHKEFKTFFLCVSSLLPTPPYTSHPNWRLDPLLKHMMWVAENGTNIGQSISVDEMYIGFQGQHKDKQRVSYKIFGDSFLVGALCAEGCTYSLYFRNQLAPRN